MQQTLKIFSVHCDSSQTFVLILVPRGRAPFGQHQESRLTNLIGSGLNLLCLQSLSKRECRWTWPEITIIGADQKERGLWEQE